MKPYLQKGFDEVGFYPLIDETQLNRLYQGKSYAALPLIYAYFRRIMLVFSLRANSVLFIEKELLPFVPAWFELFLLRKKKFVLDYDDSIFHNYDLHNISLVRKLFGKKIDKLMRNSKKVLCGSHYLLERAIASGSINNHLIPTGVSVLKYKEHSSDISSAIPIIVWIGTPQTIKYVKLIENALTRLATEKKFILRIIGGGFLEIHNVEIEILPWSADKESAFIAAADIGIMPLEDTLWEKGKCGYKLIQYMACGLPIVGSAIGENNYIIDDSCGFAVASNEEWYQALFTLLEDKLLREQMGQNGRRKFVELYTEEAIGPQISMHLNKL